MVDNRVNYDIISDMKINIPSETLHDIIKIAKIDEIKQVYLFGSRARGTHGRFSDIDLAIRGGDASSYRQDLNDFANSYLFFDTVNLDTTTSEKLKQEVAREGILLYEQA